MANNQRNQFTTHPKKSARRQRALDRFQPAKHDDEACRQASKAHEHAALVSRIGKPPRSWPAVFAA